MIEKIRHTERKSLKYMGIFWEQIKIITNLLLNGQVYSIDKNKNLRIKDGKCRERLWECHEQPGPLN